MKDEWKRLAICYFVIYFYSIDRISRLVSFIVNLPGFECVPFWGFFM